MEYTEDMIGQEHKCDNCDAIGEVCIDPYVKDVWGETNIVCLCEFCYQSKVDDI